MKSLKEEVIADIHNFFNLRKELGIAPMLFNEKEFQMQLVLHLTQSKNKYSNIYLEYYLPLSVFENRNDKTKLYPWDSNLYFDIVIVKDGEYLPIELKYKLTTVDIDIDRFGQSFKKIIRHQGAQDLGCYVFWRDVKRIECVQKIFNPKVKGGLAIFLTNDQHYWQGDVNKKSGHIEFSLSEKSMQTKSKHWHNRETSKLAKYIIDFDVDKKYNVKWQKAYNVTSKNTDGQHKSKKRDNGLFQYCMVEI